MYIKYHKLLTLSLPHQLYMHFLDIMKYSMHPKITKQFRGYYIVLFLSHLTYIN